MAKSSVRKSSKKPPVSKKKKKPQLKTLNAEQKTQLKALASCGVSQKTVSDHLGITIGNLISIFKGKPAIRRIWDEGAAQAKTKLLTKAFEMALGRKEGELDKKGKKVKEGRGNTAMVIFLLKAICGLHERSGGQTPEDAAEEIRRHLDSLNEGLGKFTGPDGLFLDPNSVSKSKKKKTAKVKKKRRGRRK